MSPLTSVGLRNLRAHKLRLGLTVVSVLLGTAFIAGALVFTDTLKKNFDTIFATSDKGVDVRVRTTGEFGVGVPTSEVTRIERVPGVRAVEPQIGNAVVVVDDQGKRISTGGAPSQGGVWTNRKLVHEPPSLKSGRAPRRAGEIAVNDGAASRYHLHVGETVKVVLSNAEVTTARIVGLYHLSFDTGGYLGALFTRDQALSLFTDGRHVPAIDVAAQPGVSETALAARIKAAVPADLEVKTGSAVRADDRGGVTGGLQFMTYLLLGFAIVALFVGTFIIYNTFAMLVAQRQRELALLRAIGAGRKQVRRSVVLEATVIGTVGSALGVGSGIGLAYGLRALLDALNFGLPAGGLVVAPRTVLVTLLVGTVVTMLAAYAPARRAGRIAPVAAMRDDGTATGGRGLRGRTIAGAVLGAGAIATTVAGRLASGAGAGAALTGLGLLGICVAALLLSPVTARWVIAPLGRVVGRPFGPVGRLARTNAVRNPRRTAATGFALTLGLVLVSGIAVVGASMKASMNQLFDDDVRADYILTTDSAVSVPLPAVRRVQDVRGVQSVTELHTLDARVGGKEHFGTAVDGPLARVLTVHLKRGSLVTRGHRMLVSESTARKNGWTLGSHQVLSVPGLGSRTVTVSGVYADDDLLGPWIVGGDVYRALTPRDRWSDEVALVSARAGADLGALRSGLEQATNDYYVVDVRDREQYKGALAGQVNGLLGLLYGLLGLAIVIAVLGIVNTQALSVVERRREIGMLRAVGMQRKQVRRTIYLESLLIAMFGALLGLGLGLSYGALFAHTLRGEGMSVIAVPWGQAALFLVLAGVAGVLAALWPGYRAARTPALEAIATA